MHHRKKRMCEGRRKEYLARVLGAGCELFVGNVYPFETNKQTNKSNTYKYEIVSRTCLYSYWF
jgi:hypothetical protein